MQTTHLASLLHVLKSLEKHFTAGSYSVPGIWTGKNSAVEQVNPAEYFTAIIESILHGSDHPVAAEPIADWREGAVVYNLFIRLTTAFDHNGDGSIATEPLSCGFRETGTLLKAIALLPYIKNLGANTVYILHITAYSIAE